MNRKSHVLMHAHIVPPDAQRVRIARLVWLGAFLAFQSPLRSLVIEFHRRHQLALALRQSVSSGPCDDCRRRCPVEFLRSPTPHDEISNLSFHAHQIAGAHAELRRVGRVHPERIRVRDFIQPLRVRAARVNLNGKTES